MTPRHACIIDTETTGLTPPPAGKDVCIEVACCLYDLELGSPIAFFSSVIAEKENPAEAINRIPVKLLQRGADPANVWQQVKRFVDAADVLIAHEASFDRGFLPAHIVGDKPWCCTKRHVDWPSAKTGEHLVHLALAHGVGIVNAHRALADVDIISRLLTAVHAMLDCHDGPAPLVRLIERAMRPRRKVAALVSYDDREKARAAGFAWDGATKTWWREVPVDEIAALPFKTRELGPSA